MNEAGYRTSYSSILKEIVATDTPQFCWEIGLRVLSRCIICFVHLSTSKQVDNFCGFGSADNWRNSKPLGEEDQD